LLKTLKHITLIIILLGVFNPGERIIAQNKPIELKKSTPPKPPKKQPSKEMLARSYYNRKDYEKAAQLYGELYNKQKKYLYYTYYYNSLVYLKKYKEAEKLCKKQTRLSPENYRYKIDLAYIYSLEGENKKATKTVNRILKNLPDNRNLIINIANTLQARRFINEALEVYEIAKKRKIGNYGYNLEMATSYQYAGEYNKMFDALIRHLDENPNDLPRVENRIQNMLVMDVDNNLSRIFKTKILTKAQAEPDNSIYAELLMWYSLQVKDFNLAFRQAKSIERRFKNQEEVMLEVADIAYSNDHYDVASKAYAYLLKKKRNSPYYLESYDGYFKSKIELANENPDTDIETWEALSGIGDKAIAEFGINRNTSDIIQQLAHVKAFRLNETNDAVTLLNKAILISMPSKEKAKLKMELADILAFTGKFWDASLLYSQVEHELKNEPSGHEAKFRNARIFYYKGEFDWAKTRLDVLKGATSKFIANDALELSMFIKEMEEEDTLGFTLRLFAASDQYAYQQKYDSALLFLSKAEAQSASPITGEYVLFKKASINEKLKRYAVADSLYTDLFTQIPESVKADNALYRSAELNRLYLNNTGKASELYLQLMKEYPESIYATKARKHYRALNDKKIKADGTS
jgi:predicted Zn-dependent protease